MPDLLTHDILIHKDSANITKSLNDCNGKVKYLIPHKKYKRQTTAFYCEKGPTFYPDIG